jgi:hypothetical protein
VSNPYFPTGGHSFFFSTDFAGVVLGGNVNTDPSVRRVQVLSYIAIQQSPRSGVSRPGLDD